MPELPEVETIVRGLREALQRREFSRVEISLPKSVVGSKESFLSALRKKRILRTERRGKYILLRLSDGQVLMIHLGMTGRLLLLSAGAPREKHTHVIFSFKSFPFQLRFVDQRQFGRLVLVRPTGEGRLESLSGLGPEPLEIPAEDFILRTRTRRREIKPLLLDQSFLAGVGNIYADEALHRARIHPRRRADSLGRRALLRLHQALKEVLLEAIGAGGTSVRNYVNARGLSGGFQKLLRVYGREGKPCLTCGVSLRRERVGGRSSFFCPRCQPPRPKKEISARNH